MFSSEIWHSVAEFRRMPRAEINLMCSAAAGNDPYFARIVREFYAQARRRHRKFPLIRQMTHGVALCRLPPTFDDYFRMIKATARRNCRKAIREGCTIRPIEINDHLPEVGQIRASMAVRQGKLMPAHYRTDQPAKRFEVHRSSNRTHDYVYFGAFLGNELVGYAYCLIAGEVCCITHILGHAKHLTRGVVPQLIIGMAKYLYENYPLVQYYAYGSYFGCRDTMKRFKRKFAFLPHQVTWQLGEQCEGQNMHVAVFPLSRIKRLAKRVLRGPTAIERVLQELSNHGVCLSRLRTVEVFAGEGTIQTIEYASQVGELDLWEIRPQCEAALRRNFPKANVKITDSFQEVTTTANRYDLIVVDNPMSVYAGEYCEHFQLFPSIFRICTANTALVLAVIPKLSKRFHARYPYLFSRQHLAGRGKFYGTDHPEDISIEGMLSTYRRLAEQSGMNIAWTYCARRSHKSDIHNLMLSLKRRPIQGQD